MLVCPYNGFKECKWEDCAARMYVKDPTKNGYMMRVCAIAYNGGNVPSVITTGCDEKEGRTNAIP